MVPPTARCHFPAADRGTQARPLHLVLSKDPISSSQGLQSPPPCCYFPGFLPTLPSQAIFLHNSSRVKPSSTARVPRPYSAPPGLQPSCLSVPRVTANISPLYASLSFSPSWASSAINISKSLGLALGATVKVNCPLLSHLNPSRVVWGCTPHHSPSFPDIFRAVISPRSLHFARLNKPSFSSLLS